MAKLEDLTARELEVLNLLNQGLKDKEISRDLEISIPTTKTHLRSIYKKLQVRNRIEATLKFRIK